MATTEERVIAILREQLDRGYPIETDSKFANDLGMEAIEGLGIIMALEESFNISIGFDMDHPGDLFFSVALTVGGLIQYVDRLVAEQS